MNEIPVISSADISIYSNGTFSFDPNTVAGNTVTNSTTYTWITPSFNPTGAIIGASATTTPQQIISQTLENTTNSPVKVTYTITPTSTTCSGNTFTLEVTVNPSINPNAVVWGGHRDRPSTQSSQQSSKTLDPLHTHRYRIQTLGPLTDIIQ